MKLYLKYYFSFLAAGFVVVSFSIMYLYLAGEYASSKDIVSYQRSNPHKSIYGSALHNNTVEYKLNLLKHALPEIVVLGSSRVMQFRQHMFTAETITLGGAMNSVVETAEIYSAISEANPKIVILGADIWWFNEAHSTSQVINAKEDFDIAPNLYDAWSVIKWLYNGKINFNDILNTFIGKKNKDWGVTGQYKDGFGPDGSKYYTLTVTGEKESEDIKFTDTYARINGGKRRFQYAPTADDILITKFVKLINDFEENGIPVIVFFPPLAPSVFSKIIAQGERYQYINDLKAKLNKLDINYFDYTDPNTIDSNDCEFIDGFHGGEVTYMRILKDLNMHSSILNQYVIDERLLSFINEHKGRTFIPDIEITSMKEVDYLKLGCEK